MVELAEVVRWGDRDILGHVNNVVWARWLEDGRGQLFAAAGITGFAAGEDPRPAVGPVLARIEIDYRRPVFFPDTIRVRTRVSTVGRTSFGLDQELWSDAQGSAIGAARAVVVMVDYGSGTPIPLDPAVRAGLEALRER